MKTEDVLILKRHLEQEHQEQHAIKWPDVQITTLIGTIKESVKCELQSPLMTSGTGPNG